MARPAGDWNDLMRVLSFRRLLLGLLILTGLAGSWLFGVTGAAPTQAGEAVVLPAAPFSVPQDRPLRLAVLGTSLSSHAVWPDALADRLSDCAPAGIVVSRAARPGATSRDGLAALHGLTVGTTPPDLLLVEFSDNDAALRHALTLPASRDRHQRIIAQARAAGAEVILMTMSPAWGLNAAERPGLRRYQALYRDLASETGVGLIDTVAAWQGLSADDRARLIPDGLHPTDAGQEQVLLPVAEAALRSLICAK